MCLRMVIVSILIVYVNYEINLTTDQLLLFVCAAITGAGLDLILDIAKN